MSSITKELSRYGKPLFPTPTHIIPSLMRLRDELNKVAIANVLRTACKETIEVRQPDRVEKLIRDIGSAPTVEDALRVFQAAYEIDFVTYHLALTVVDVVDTPFVRTTYTAEWVSRYLQRDYVKIDPILREGLAKQMPFYWRDVEVSNSAHAFLLDAHNHGLGPNGFSIPVVDMARRALFSLNSHKATDEWGATVELFRNEWRQLALLIHHKAIFELHGAHDPVPKLSSREIECLHWTALGKDSIDISFMLKLSEHTTRAYIKSARHKLGGGSITFTIARAMQLRLINPFGPPPN